jgi:hypothetical protein
MHKNNCFHSIRYKTLNESKIFDQILTNGTYNKISFFTLVHLNCHQTKQVVKAGGVKLQVTKLFNLKNSTHLIKKPTN